MAQTNDMRERIAEARRVAEHAQVARRELSRVGQDQQAAKHLLKKAAQLVVQAARVQDRANRRIQRLAFETSDGPLGTTVVPYMEAVHGQTRLTRDVARRILHVARQRMGSRVPDSVLDEVEADAREAMEEIPEEEAEELALAVGSVIAEAGLDEILAMGDG